jgi:methylamine dehydrogenase accessory protein MauD
VFDMTSVLIASQIFSWLIILGLAVALLALARQVGVLHMRVAPAGALTPAKGPIAGEMSPKLNVTAIDGTSITIGALLEKGHKQLLLFVSPHCPICKELIPVAQSFAKREDVDILFMGDDAPADIEAITAKMGIDGRSFVNSPSAGRAFHIDKLPNAVLIGEDGRILSKGLVNSREHLESLVVSHEMGVVSVQDYLAGLKSKVA